MAFMQMAENVLDPLEHQDIAMLSPHKFAGGPGSAGVLVIKRSVLRGTQPQIPGALLRYLALGHRVFQLTARLRRVCAPDSMRASPTRSTLHWVLAAPHTKHLQHDVSCALLSA